MQKLRWGIQEVDSEGKGKAAFPLLLHLEEIKCKKNPNHLEHLLHFQCENKLWFQHFQMLPCARSSLPFSWAHIAHQGFIHPSVLVGTRLIVATETVTGASVSPKNSRGLMGTWQISVCGENSYDCLSGYFGELLHSAINANYLACIWNTDAQNSQPFWNFIIKPLSRKRVDII